MRVRSEPLIVLCVRACASRFGEMHGQRTSQTSARSRVGFESPSSAVSWTRERITQRVTMGHNEDKRLRSSRFFKTRAARRASRMSARCDFASSKTTPPQCGHVFVSSNTNCRHPLQSSSLGATRPGGFGVTSALAPAIEIVERQVEASSTAQRQSRSARDRRVVLEHSPPSLGARVARDASCREHDNDT